MSRHKDFVIMEKLPDGIKVLKQFLQHFSSAEQNEISSFFDKMRMSNLKKFQEKEYVQAFTKMLKNEPMDERT